MLLRSRGLHLTPRDGAATMVLSRDRVPEVSNVSGRYCRSLPARDASQPLWTTRGNFACGREACRMTGRAPPPPPAWRRSRSEAGRNELCARAPRPVAEKVPCYASRSRRRALRPSFCSSRVRTTGGSRRPRQARRPVAPRPRTGWHLGRDPATEWAAPIARRSPSAASSATSSSTCPKRSEPGCRRALLFDFPGVRAQMARACGGCRASASSRLARALHTVVPGRPAVRFNARRASAPSADPAEIRTFAPNRDIDFIDALLDQPEQPTAIIVRAYSLSRLLDGGYFTDNTSTPRLHDADRSPSFAPVSCVLLHVRGRSSLSGRSRS